MCIVCFPFQISFQIPSTTHANQASTSRDTSTVKHSLNAIPISVMEGRFVLMAVFVYSEGVNEKDIGHYAVAVKINDKFEIYDDLEAKCQEVSGEKKVIVHALLYLRRNHQ